MFRSSVPVAGRGKAVATLQKNGTVNHSIISTAKQTVPVKIWDKGVEIDAETREQLKKVAQLPIIHSHVAAMPDAHVGIGATVGAVIPCVGAVIPAAVGVDIGCGMIAVQTSLKAKDLPDSLKQIRSAVEAAIPHGRTAGGKPDIDQGGWKEDRIPGRVLKIWREHLRDGFHRIIARYPVLEKGNLVNHLGTLSGTGNHFVELCLDETDSVWCMLHSGSRGVGNRIGEYFIALAKKDMGHLLGSLPDKSLAYRNLKEGTQHFNDYVEAVGWAQEFARWNRHLMMEAFLETLRKSKLPPFTANLKVVNCHHNYVNKELHFGKEVWLTRKGAVSARKGELGIIPGSMGTRSYIVRGLGNAESFHSCSHGAGRRMSRTEATKRFTLADHERATSGIECRKDKGVLDETPAAYKDIDSVIAAQSDLVEIVHTLRQVMCVKG